MLRNLPTTENVLILTSGDSEVETRPTNDSLLVGLGGGNECSSHARGGEGRASCVLR